MLSENGWKSMERLFFLQHQRHQNKATCFLWKVKLSEFWDGGERPQVDVVYPEIIWYG